MECIACEEPITNPVCPACLQAGVEQWLLEKDEYRLAAEVRELTRNVFANNGTTFCIKCDSLMSLCAYCYTLEVFRTIKKRPDLVKEYLLFLNFDLEHQGWERDARNYIDE